MKPCLGIEQIRLAKARWKGNGSRCGKDSMAGIDATSNAHKITAFVLPRMWIACGQLH